MNHLAESIVHVEGGDCRCLRCEAFYKGPEYAASIREAQRLRRQKAADAARQGTIKDERWQSK